MMPMNRRPSRVSVSRRLPSAVLVGLLALATAAAPLLAASSSARYRFEGNKWLSLDLTVSDVAVKLIKFEWPATLMGIRTGYKATLKVANGSARQTGVGLAVALYDQDGKLIGAGTGGTTLGTIDPGDSAEFSIEFKDVTERLEQTAQFDVALQVR
ncbi:MAG TPA: FxLYD domain-containing protein [Candidatus Polarisedimenticolia bacterium]|nr:FxLYD domain-containing protein [Candidatus Polarisedimenticolia bacterium]